MLKNKIIDIIIYSTVLFFFVTPFHEFWHFTIGTALGGTGFDITYWDLFNGRCTWDAGTVHAPWLVYLSGGVITGLFLLAVGWRALVTPTKWDESLQFAAFIFGGAQVGYGLGELSLAFASTQPYFLYFAGASAAAGVLPFMIWRGPKLLKWLAAKDSV